MEIVQNTILASLIPEKYWIEEKRECCVKWSSRVYSTIKNVNISSNFQKTKRRYVSESSKCLCRCEMKYVLLEMDRILRPNGYAIIRESSYFVDAVATIAKGMRWGCRKEETEYGIEKEKILICQKKIWYSSNQNSRWKIEE